MSEATRGPLLAAIEGGGTKFLCALGREPGRWLERARIDTRDGESTTAELLEFFLQAFARHGRAEALGLACFGPIRCHGPEAGTFLSTPKPGWSRFPLGRRLQEGLGLPLAVAADVQGAALAEGRWGAARGLEDFVYLTVGTGIGGGAVVGGRLLGGVLHPEMGHLRIPRHPRDGFAGVCPFHGDCWEGLACGPAVERRWGRRGEELEAGHPAHALEAWYLARGCWSLAAALAPQRIILGGGVLAGEGLLEQVREEFARTAGGYLEGSGLDDPRSLIVPPGIDSEAGLWGAWLLAEEKSRRP